MKSLRTITGWALITVVIAAVVALLVALPALLTWIAIRMAVTPGVSSGIRIAILGAAVLTYIPAILAVRTGLRRKQSGGQFFIPTPAERSLLHSGNLSKSGKILLGFALLVNALAVLLWTDMAYAHFQDGRPWGKLAVSAALWTVVLLVNAWRFTMKPKTGATSAPDPV